MKSILLIKTSPLIFSFSLILSVGLLFSFSNYEKSNAKAEFLSIVVNYHIDFRLVDITEGSSSFKRIAILHPNNNRSLLLNWLKKEDYTIVRKKFCDSFNNKYIFELMQEYKVKGWELNSHNFGIGKSIEEDIQISYYLFTKK
jgi:hypothetical protein